jgi:hypothetical protein
LLTYGELIDKLQTNIGTNPHFWGPFGGAVKFFEGLDDDPQAVFMFSVGDYLAVWSWDDDPDGELGLPFPLSNPNAPFSRIDPPNYSPQACIRCGIFDQNEFPGPLLHKNEWVAGTCPTDGGVICDAVFDVRNTQFELVDRLISFSSWVVYNCTTEEPFTTIGCSEPPLSPSPTCWDELATEERRGMLTCDIPTPGQIANLLSMYCCICPLDIRPEDCECGTGEPCWLTGPCYNMIYHIGDLCEDTADGGESECWDDEDAVVAVLSNGEAYCVKDLSVVQFGCSNEFNVSCVAAPESDFPPCDNDHFCETIGAGACDNNETIRCDEYIGFGRPPEVVSGPYGVSSDGYLRSYCGPSDCNCAVENPPIPTTYCPPPTQEILEEYASNTRLEARMGPPCVFVWRADVRCDTWEDAVGGPPIVYLEETVCLKDNLLDTCSLTTTDIAPALSGGPYPKGEWYASEINPGTNPCFDVVTFRAVTATYPPEDGQFCRCGYGDCNQIDPGDFPADPFSLVAESLSCSACEGYFVKIRYIYTYDCSTAEEGGPIMDSLEVLQCNGTQTSDSDWQYHSKVGDICTWEWIVYGQSDCNLTPFGEPTTTPNLATCICT